MNGFDCQGQGTDAVVLLRAVLITWFMGKQQVLHSRRELQASEHSQDTMK